VKRIRNRQLLSAAAPWDTISKWHLIHCASGIFDNFAKRKSWSKVGCRFNAYKCLSGNEYMTRWRWLCCESQSQLKSTEGIGFLCYQLSALLLRFSLCWFFIFFSFLCFPKLAKFLARAFRLAASHTHTHIYIYT